MTDPRSLLRSIRALQERLKGEVTPSGRSILESMVHDTKLLQRTMDEDREKRGEALGLRESR